jgi:hypothetical protein
MSIRSLLPLVWAALGAVAGAQNSSGCRFCGEHGESDCKKHGQLAAERELLLPCSVAIECKACAGALTTDCKICSNPAVEQAAETRKKLAREWLSARRKAIDEVTGGKEIQHCKSRYVDLAWSVRGLTVGKNKLEAHELMHLYVQRIHELRAKFNEVFGAQDNDYSARLEVFVWKDLEDHKRLAPRVAGGGGGGASQKLMGASSVFSVYHDNRTMPGDEGLHRSIVHNVTHLLLSNLQPAQWLGNRKHGWVDEGVAHWFEDLITGKCTNYCHEEVGIAIGAGYKTGRWRVPVRKLAEAGKLKPFAQIAQLNTDQLDWQDHAQVFAQVDFLIGKYGGKAFAQMTRALKLGKATRDAVQEAFGLSMLQIDQDLAAWIKATYPLEEKT